MWLLATNEEKIMGKVIWRGFGDLTKIIQTPIAIITGANLKKKSDKEDNDKTTIDSKEGLKPEILTVEPEDEKVRSE